MNKKQIAAIVFFGSIWGFFEVSIGGILHFFRTPYTGLVMSSIGFSLLYMALKNNVKPAHLVFISLIAACFKFIDVPLFGLPINDMHIANPATAIASMGIASYIVFINSKFNESFKILIPKFFLTATFSAVMFNLMSVFIYHWPTGYSINSTSGFLLQMISISIFSSILYFLINSIKLHTKILNSNLKLQFGSAAVFTILAALISILFKY